MLFWGAGGWRVGLGAGWRGGRWWELRGSPVLSASGVQETPLGCWHVALLTLIFPPDAALCCEGASSAGCV